jgi:hypothetical protein
VNFFHTMDEECPNVRAVIFSLHGAAFSWTMPLDVRMSRQVPATLLALALLAIAAVIIVAVRPFVHQPSPAPTAAIQSSTDSIDIRPPAGHWPTPFSVEVKALPSREALPPGTLRILVVGDSVAKFLGLAMRYRQDEAGAFVAERGVGNCSIFEGTPYIENGKQLMSSSCSMNWASDVAELHPDVTLIMMGGGYFDRTACTAAFRDAYEKRVFELVAAMGENAGRIVMTRVPYPVKAWRHSNIPERVDCFNELLVDIAKKGKYDVLDLMSYVCPTRECNMESQGKPIRPDGLHFDGGGAEDTARWVLGELLRRMRGQAAHPGARTP